MFNQDRLQRTIIGKSPLLSALHKGTEIVDIVHAKQERYAAKLVGEGKRTSQFKISFLLIWVNVPAFIVVMTISFFPSLLKSATARVLQPGDAFSGTDDVMGELKFPLPSFCKTLIVFPALVKMSRVPSPFTSVSAMDCAPRRRGALPLLSGC